MIRRFFAACFTLALLLFAFVAWQTRRDLRPLPSSLNLAGSAVRKAQVVDRRGVPLSVTYQNEWNLHDQAALHEIPRLLQQAFIQSEDRRFHRHHGVDWRARVHAVWQNITALQTVRGASTITEQVVRMLHPRPRTIWSRWLEGIEAGRLEERFSKAAILEFYLNQVPYAHRRRGVVQAASLYFDRDLTTLNTRELLTLVVLVRAPSAMDLRRDCERAAQAVGRLAGVMRANGTLSDDQYQRVMSGSWSLSTMRLPVEAGHFIRYLQRHSLTDEKPAPAANHSGKLPTTLDASLQQHVQQILDTRLQDLRDSGVADGAVLVVDHQSDEVLAWVNGGGLSQEQAGGWIDAVITPRQPGSTLKPFLYALALEMGWTAATLIDDTPLVEPVGSGLHRFDNYSRRCYGPVRLRDALGNSLNIPAVRTVQFTGTKRFLDVLKQLGIGSLRQPADHYGAGIALGNGEVSLFELVQAYAAVARGGVFRPLRTVRHPAPRQRAAQRVFRAETAALIGNILSDPQARRLEFGAGHLLHLPFQTAVKTGTSNDHRDVWTFGFSSDFTVGVWMGNLDRKPTRGVTGTSGPALVLRAVFAELNRRREPKPLQLSCRLMPAAICRHTGLRAADHCPVMQEWFAAGTVPAQYCLPAGLHDTDLRQPATHQPERNVALVQPTPGLKLVMDPHIPDDMEAFALIIPKHLRPEKVEWLVDERLEQVTAAGENRFMWPLSAGTHTAQARIWQAGKARPLVTPPVRFQVK
ncbi:transglycosylase domain-containing protein [Desulfoferrobacter suflitae]|uniref:transglycosylase domain-containing protein n=1 Tax=Desulfoferrobacter suflitae TaxID=2865782 RepID=UPI0021643010|nr:transglycosylase domain-containing protein [Desulfoferrobacter suflitae]MCK8601234.1 transglycosylase domain-containing protein [Desulfoferrobacter suflitae]